jgi:CCR4-NOT transcription complex subunit 1
MEVFSKYFRRVLQNNAAQVFGTGGRNTEPNGSYQILVTEIQKLRKEPEQADKIAESISSNEGDLFRDFDLSTFISHFQMDPISRAMLALACRRTDLRAKGGSAPAKQRYFVLTII